jgi:hypothetical protein
MKDSLNFGFLATILTMAILFIMPLIGVFETLEYKIILIFGLVYFPITTVLYHVIRTR